MNCWIKSELTPEEQLNLLAFRKYTCSACGFSWGYGKTKYCPDCGAKMEDKDAE